MSVKEYFFRFVKVFKYASSLVSNSRDEISRFVTGVLDDLEEERRASTLHNNIHLGRVMVYAQQVEESHWRMRDPDRKKSSSSDHSNSINGNNSFGVWDRPKFNKGHNHFR